MTNEVRRISPQQVHQDLASDAGAVLVCAYEEPEKFEQNHLEGAIPLEELESQADAQPRDLEIIFYCA